MTVIKIFLCVLSLSGLCYSAKILGVFPTPAKSHFILVEPLLQELIKSGHELTVISPLTIKNPPKNYRHINTAEMYKLFESKMLTLADKFDESVFDKIYDIQGMGVQLTNVTFNNPDVKKLIKSGEKFDLVLLEVFVNEAMIGFGNCFKAPTIAISTVGPSRWVTQMTGSPLPLSYVPNLFLNYVDKMTFTQRLVNTYASVVDTVLYEFIFKKVQADMYDAAFPDPKPSFDDAIRHTVSLALLNSHFSINYPQPLLPNMIEVGGMHVKTKSDPLPANIKAFIESSKEGVVYFSLGSNLRPSLLPKEKLAGIFNALKSIKQKVLMKIDEPELFEKSDKIFVSKWFPQDDIFAHSNIKLFVTHGGLLSCTEALYHGIPLVGIPFFGDQSLNMARIESVGLGVHVDFQNLTETSLKWALNEILNNDHYLNKAKLYSKRFRDQPMKPIDTAKFWIDYVLRHNGATHLQSVAQDLSFIEYHMIDVWVTIAAIIGLTIALLCLICSKILNKVFGKTKAPQKHKKKD